MQISFPWLQSFFSVPLPDGAALAETLTRHSFETGYDPLHNVLAVDVLPNRSSDCLSHYGVAREVSAVLGIPIQDLLTDPLLPLGKGIKVVADPALCDRYMAIRLTGIRPDAKTPRWMKERLGAVGQRSISPAVDITNFVMFEMGQPMHAFDVARLEQKNETVSIGVRLAVADDSLTLLGESEPFTPPTGTPLIVDAEVDRPLGLAGIKGGSFAGVTEKTQEIVLECAHFNRVGVYNAARSLGISTDASYRFERNPSPLLVPYAARRAVSLYKDITGGRVTAVIDTGAAVRLGQRFVPAPGITFSKMLGVRVTHRSVTATFDRLGFQYEVIRDVRKRVIKEARQHLGVPYRYGASVSYDAPRFFDCSGFVSYCFLKSGIPLPRISANIFHYGTLIPREKVRVGDCVVSAGLDAEKQWTDTRDREAFPYLPDREPLREPVGHIGILTSPDTVIHAAGSGDG